MDSGRQHSRISHHVVSPPGELPERLRMKRSPDHEDHAYPEHSRISGSAFDRGQLPPILDRGNQQYISPGTRERPSDDASNFRFPHEPASGSYMVRYRPPESASHSSFPAAPSYRRELPFDIKARHQKWSHDLPTSGLPQKESDTDERSSTFRVKRPRVSLACLFCRNRKSRCDGIRPTCKTCSHMKLDCKWPESDLRRAKPVDRTEQQDKSTTRSEDDQLSPDQSTADAENASSRPRKHHEPSTRRPSDKPLHPIPSGFARGLSASETERYGSSQAPKSLAYDAHDHYTTASSAVVGDRYQPISHLMSDPRGTDLHRNMLHRPSISSQDVSAAEKYQSRQLHPRRAEQRTLLPSYAAMQCRARAARVAMLARPSTDAKRRMMDESLAREMSLETLLSPAGPDERLDLAFSSDWEALGGISAAAYRPFMDLVAGILAIIEVKMVNDADSVHAQSRNCRLHMFRLVNEPHAAPDLRHCSVALDLSSHDERELRRSSASYNHLGYPTPVDRLRFSLQSSVIRVVAELQAKAAEAKARDAQHRRSPIHSITSQGDSSPTKMVVDVKPSRAVLEAFFRIFHQEIGEQMPGLDFDLIDERTRDGSISPLLANALCCIGASLYEQGRRQLPDADALSSESYLRQSRALIGSALGKEDLETVLALGVIGIRDMLMGLWTSAATIVSSAMRLCIQLDLHRTHSSPASSTARELDGPRLFWMIYSLDRITALVTARPATIKDSDIDVDFPPTMRKSEPCIFSALVRQLHYAGGLAEIQAGESRLTDVERQRAAERELVSIEEDLVGHYESLPVTLRLNAGNLQRAHDLGQGLSFAQLHLTHNSALIRRFLMSRSIMSDADYELMRTAAHEIAEVSRLAQALDDRAMSASPLSSTALFLAGCVAMADIEMLEEQDEREAIRRKSGGVPPPSTGRSIAAQLQAARSTLSIVTDTLERQSWIWPAPRVNLEILSSQARQAWQVSESALLALIDQIEAVQVIVRRPDSPGIKSEFKEVPLVKVQRETNLEELLATFPQMY